MRSSDYRRAWTWFCPWATLGVAVGILFLMGLSVFTAVLAAMLLVCPAIILWGAIKLKHQPARAPLELPDETRILSMRVSAPELKLTQLGLPMFLGWEFLQSPFYMDTFTESWTRVLYNRVHCTGGDMIILLGAFWVVGLLCGRSWIKRGTAAPGALFIASGLLYTIFSEYRNVYLAQNWAYSGWMPTIGGIGLVPIAQWLIIPPLLVRAVRKSARLWEK